MTQGAFSETQKAILGTQGLYQGLREKGCPNLKNLELYIPRVASLGRWAKVDYCVSNFETEEEEKEEKQQQPQQQQQQEKEKGKLNKGKEGQTRAKER